MPERTPPDLRVGVFQFSPRRRDVADNIRRIVSAAPAAADIIITPELSLTGYDIRDDVHDLAAALQPEEPPEALKPLASLGDKVIAVGMIERGADHVPYNVAALWSGGELLFIHRKMYLPTYGMFDEARWFGRGRQLETVELHGWHCGILICEDFWHPGLVYVLASRGIDVLFVMAAGAGRGVTNDDQTAFASVETWDGIARTTATLYGIYVVLCNRTGVEGGLTFAGNSIVVAPDGEIIRRGSTFDEEVFTVALEQDRVRRARQPYAHIRDDEPGLVADLLTRYRG